MSETFAFGSCNGVIVGGEKTKDDNEQNWIKLEENGVSIKVEDETFSKRPSRTKFFFNPKMVVNREFTMMALLAMVEGRKPTKIDSDPVEALDAFAASGISGMRWKKMLKSDIRVFLTENEDSTYERLELNVKENNLNVETDWSKIKDDSNEVYVANEDCNLTLLKKGFDFVHLDPFGCPVPHFEATFRNLKNGGICVITSTDTGSLFGKVPTVAKRNYDAFVIRTEYFREIAARMVIGAAAKVAARCNKGIEVLYVVAMEHFVQVALKVVRGAKAADESVEKVSKIIHCLVCEERTLFPNSNHPIENPNNQLHCECTKPLDKSCEDNLCSVKQNNRILLGPLWCGKIFDCEFIKRMIRLTDAVKDINKIEKLFLNAKTKELLLLIEKEAECSGTPANIRLGSVVSEVPLEAVSLAKSVEVDEEVSSAKKRKILVSEDNQNESEHTVSDSSTQFLTELSEGEPLFYFLTHSHLPKGLEQPKMPRLVEDLQRAGFRASRTHFDTGAVRTTASAVQLKAVMTQSCKPIPSKR